MNNVAVATRNKTMDDTAGLRTTLPDKRSNGTLVRPGDFIDLEVTPGDSARSNREKISKGDLIRSLAPDGENQVVETKAQPNL